MNPIARTAFHLALPAQLLLALTLIVLPWALSEAHDFRIGRLVVDHPYADPAPAGAAEARVYLRALKNRGDKADRLLGVRCAIASAVEIRNQAKGAAKATTQSRLELDPDSVTKLRPGDEWQLVLLKPNSALKSGDSFKLTLYFEHAGDAEVMVQVRKAGAASRADEN
jgi:copper(I)-binding protein